MKKTYRYLPVILTMGFLLLVQQDDAAGSPLPLHPANLHSLRPFTIEQIVGGGSRCSETVRALL